MSISRINVNAFMNASLRARKRVYEMSIEDLIKDMSAPGKIANVGNNKKLGNTPDGMKFPAHFSCNRGLNCDACRNCKASFNPDDFNPDDKKYDGGYCYAQKGKQGMYSCQVNYWKQYRLLSECPEIYAGLVSRQFVAAAAIADCNNARLLDSGDVFTDDVYDVVFPHMATNTGDIRFMYYTDMYQRLNAAIDAGKIDFAKFLPVISADCGVNVHDDVVVNPHHLPISIVVDDVDNENEIKAALPAYVKSYIVCDCSKDKKAGCDGKSCGHKCWSLEFEQAVIFGKH